MAETARAKGTDAQGLPWAALGVGLAVVAAILAGVGLLAVRHLRGKV